MSRLNQTEPAIFSYLSRSVAFKVPLSSISVHVFSKCWHVYVCIVLIFRPVLVGQFQYPSQNRFGCCSIIPRIIFVGFNFCLWRFFVICWIYVVSDPLSKCDFIQFRPLFARLGHIHSFIWGHYIKPLIKDLCLIWKYRIEGSMFTAKCIPSFGMVQNWPVYWCKY
jgi:hypothetical protein